MNKLCFYARLASFFQGGKIHGKNQLEEIGFFPVEETVF